MHLTIYRKQKKLTLADFCPLIGVNQNTLSRYERGESAMPLPMAAKIVEITNGEVTMDDLVAMQPRGDAA